MGIFIGREAALEALLTDLSGPATHTIANIHGLGGVGKTTLKAEALLRLQAAGAMIPFFHADENAARADLADFLGALAENFYQPWEGPAPDFPRLQRLRNRLRDLKGRLVREPAADLLDRGLKTALSGLARRALLSRNPALDAPGPAQLADGPAAPPLQQGRSSGATISQADASDTSPSNLQADASRPHSAPSLAGFTFQSQTAHWSKADQQAYETAVASWTHDREDRELLLDPLAALTRALLDDLADFLFPPQTSGLGGLGGLGRPGGFGGLGGLLGNHRPPPQAPLRVLLVIDSYEALDAGIQEWLLTHLLPALDRHRIEGRPLAEWLDLRLLLCGRQALRDADPLRRWDALAGRIRDLDLGRFEQAEVASYLAARGLDPDRAPEALAQTQGLPYMLALWCDSAGHDQALATERAARRIFWWKSPEQVRWIQAAAALHEVTRDGLAVVLADGREAEAYGWLAANTEVCRSEGTAIAVHPIVRELVQAALRQQSPAEAAELERRARLSERLARLRHQVGPASFERLLTLAPLRWFDASILRSLWPTQASAILDLLPTAPATAAAPIQAPVPVTAPASALTPASATVPAIAPASAPVTVSLPGAGPVSTTAPIPPLGQPAAPLGDLLASGPFPDSWAVTETLRGDLTAYLELTRPGAYREALDAIVACDRQREQRALDDRSRARSDAESLARDASVARRRVVALESRMVALQGQEKTALEAHGRAQQASAALDRAPARRPWLSAAATAALGSVLSFGALPLLSTHGPMASIGRGVLGLAAAGTVLAAAAFAFTLRALALPRPASPSDRAAARHDLDACAERLAQVRADLAQVLLEVSAAGREADALDHQATQAEALATGAFVPLL